MINFVNITEEEFLKTKLLYKYMSLENALRTLNEKYLWFSNPAAWKDPSERRFLEAKYINDKGQEVDFKWKDRVFCTCLTQTQTSEAYWNNYKNDSIGIELKLYREKLIEELSHYDSSYDIFIGRAEYLKTSDIIKDLSEIPFNPPIASDVQMNSDIFASRLFLLKRIAYKYEDEIRIILVKKALHKGNGVKLKFNCKNTDLIHQIVLDPNLESNTANMLKGVYTEKYDFIPFPGKTKGLGTSRVLQSQLYKKQHIIPQTSYILHHERY